jgi:hypothetical protein
MKNPVIKFSHRYKKMPPYFKSTYISDVEKKNYMDLTEEFIKSDTEIAGGGFYELPLGELLIIKLYTDGHEWQTIRSWNPEKEKYYRSIIGKEVEIKIEL